MPFYTFSTTLTPDSSKLDANFATIQSYMDALSLVSGSHRFSNSGADHYFGFYEFGVLQWNLFCPASTDSAQMQIRQGTTAAMVFDAGRRVGVGGVPAYLLDVLSGSAGVILRTRNTASSFQISLGTDANTAYIDAGNAPLGLYSQGSEWVRIGTTGHVAAGTDNAQTLGAAAKRWSVVYAGTGSINTSDSREKTPLAQLTDSEMEAAKQLAREVGTFRFLSAVKEKGADRARLHVGLTVQRAIQIMELNGLDPMAYGFICHDEWPETLIPPVMEFVGTGVLDGDGSEIQKKVEKEPGRAIPAGDRYGFRTDELLMFMARGFEGRLTALESR